MDDAVVQSGDSGADMTTLAKRIVEGLRPSTVLDVGCGRGMLVQALLKLEVIATGVDPLGVAPSHDGGFADRQTVVQGDPAEPFGDRYDLIICVELLQCYAAEASAAIVANLCAHTDDILFSSSPDDFGVPANVNVQPTEHWVELFARHGFFHDLDYDASYIRPWAMRLLRRGDPSPRVIADYERSQVRQKEEARQRNLLIARLSKEVDRLQSEVERLTALADMDGHASIARLERQLSDAHSRQLTLVEVNERTKKQLAELEGSIPHQFVSRVVRVGTALLPPGSPRRLLTGRALRASRNRLLRLRGRTPVPSPAEVERARHLKTNAQYHQWLLLTQPSTAQLMDQRRIAGSWTTQPLISICMPVFMPRLEWLEAAIDTVRAQSYPNWELCIADDRSPDPGVRSTLDRLARDDDRIKVAYRSQNGGISNATNSAMELASGDFVAFFDNDDLLAPQALFAAVSRLQGDPDIDMFYSDEDLLLPSGERGEPFFKPDWSPHTLLACNVVTHFMILRRRVLEAVGPLKPDLDGAQDHDLALRASEVTNRICHIPDVLYTWRQSPGSTAMDSDAKPEARNATVRAVADALGRRGVNAAVSQGAFPGGTAIRYALPKPHPHVSIVIPTRDRLDRLTQCIQSIERLTTYDNYSITILDNDSAEAATTRYLANSTHAVERCEGPFNYSRIVNRGVAATKGEYVVTLNNDVVLKTADWLEQLLGLCIQDGVGCVGCQLQSPDGRKQHEGIVVDALGQINNLSFDLPGVRLGPVMLGVRDVVAVTGACTMVSRRVWDEVGGLNADLAVAFNDVDFCLRLGAAGYSVVYTPAVQLTHAESSSRGRMHPLDDEKLFLSRWKTDGGCIDPYFSHHLKLGAAGWEIHLPGERRRRTRRNPDQTPL